MPAVQPPIPKLDAKVLRLLGERMDKSARCLYYGKTSQRCMYIFVFHNYQVTNVGCGAINYSSYVSIIDLFDLVCGY